MTFNSHPKPGPDRWLTGTLMLLVVLAVDLVMMPRQIRPSDAATWRQETFAILKYGRLSVDPSLAKTSGEPGQQFVLNESNGRYYSKFGIVNSLMSLPPMAIERLVYGDTPPPAGVNLLLLNGWNILLSLALAAILYVIAGRYCSDPRRQAAFVLACLFATFLWFYQRAQEIEIYHPLFFALLFECLLRALKRSQPSLRWTAAMWFFAGLLVLSRILYGLLIPLLWCAGAMAAKVHRQPWRRALGAALAGPALILALLGWVNQVKFGSPFLTGYHQWRPDQHQLIGDWLSGTYGLLFSGHWSIFLYFPVLLAALPGMRRFGREHPFDAAVVIGTFLAFLLVLGKIPSWRGEWSYGPRYLLFALPVLSMPALYFGRDWTPRPVLSARLAAVGLAAAVLGVSLWMQWEVNRREFWFCYQVQNPLQRRMTRDMMEYFLDQQEGMVIHDLESHRNDLDQTQLFRELHRGGPLSEEEIEGYKRFVLAALTNTNLYWFPPASATPANSSAAP